MALVKAKKKILSNCRSLGTIEREALELIEGESIITVPKELLENFERVFFNSKHRKELQMDTVVLEDFFLNIVEDDYFQTRMS